MKRIIIILLVVLILLVPACSLNKPPLAEGDDLDEPTVESPTIELGIHFRPIQERRIAQPITSVPKYDPDFKGLWQVDLRNKDLSGLDLTQQVYDLLHSEFNSVTVWPHKLPDKFDPIEIININKSPGLNIDKLHQRGITGQGIGIGIIDYPLVLNHVEYGEKIRYYDHLFCDWDESHFHGPLVASIAVGENLGVAPGADLYYIANFTLEMVDGTLLFNYSRLARAIERMVEVNQSLPAESKIRVLSLSQGFNPNQIGYSRLQRAITQAEDDGIFVVSANVFQHNEQFHFHGLYKEALADPNDFDAYVPYSWDKWIAMVTRPIDSFEKFYELEYDKSKNKQILLIPMGGITAAHSTGSDHYLFSLEGGWSSAIPYIAGLYALACQAKPEVTPEEFWYVAYETGIKRVIIKDGSEFEARIPHPEDLIQYLAEN